MDNFVPKPLDILYARVDTTDSKRNATVTFPASAFTSELHFCWQHAKAFSAEASAFYGRNA